MALHFFFVCTLLHSEEREYEEQYQAITTFLNCYQRPFTILDIGAKEDGCSFKTAYDYNAVCVMTKSQDDSNQLLNSCNNHPELNNIILLNKIFTFNDLEHLSECEHFDLILAFDLFRDFGDQWEVVINTILNLGDYIIVEVLLQNFDAINYLKEKGGCLLTSIPHQLPENQTVLYLIQSKKKYLQRKTWLRSKMKANNYCIDSSFFHKQLTKPISWPKNSYQTCTWLPGINLLTFKMCNGAYPTKEMLKKSLSCINDTSHSDWLINNMILQGNKLVTIDGNDESCRAFFSNDLLKSHQELIDIDDPLQVEHYFWNKLIKIPRSKRQLIKYFCQLFPPNSLVFAIGAYDEISINDYLGYGAKIIYADSDKIKKQELSEKFKQEDFTLTDNCSIDDMIARYGMPQFCKIDKPGGSVYNSLKTLSQSIPSLAHTFDVRFQDDLEACLNHLALLGYTEFNFSVRDIDYLVLQSNKYINTNKQWVLSIDELLNEINDFSRLDYDGTQLSGFIYAKKTYIRPPDFVK